jgi:5-formyltetrahydrofolate cyclo-ligase
LNELQRSKAACRRRLLAARAAVADPGERSARIRETVLALPSVQDAGTVFCFISWRSEVDTHALIDALKAAGKQVLVPRILGDRMIAVPFEGWDRLVPGVLGIPVPPATEPWPGPVDVVITPGLGFGRDGSRLGYGKGYYDGWFAAHPAPPRIAVGFACQVVPDLPAGPKDVRVDLIVTEVGVSATGARPAHDQPQGPADPPGRRPPGTERGDRRR